MGWADLRPELPRTLFHVLGGVILVLAGWFLPGRWNVAGLGSVFAGALTVDLLRNFSPSFNRLSQRVLGLYMRRSEMDGFTGAPAFTGGTFLAFLLFPRPVAAAAMVPLVFGDRAAILAGKGFGRVRVGGKTLEGSLACFAVSLGVYLLLARLFPDAFPMGWAWAAGAALVGTAAEALPRPLDDNLTIPLAVGAFLYFAG